MVIRLYDIRLSSMPVFFCFGLPLPEVVLRFRFGMKIPYRDVIVSSEEPFQGYGLDQLNSFAPVAAANQIKSTFARLMHSLAWSRRTLTRCFSVGAIVL